MVGVAPSGADCAKGVGETPVKNAMDGIVGRSIEIAGDDGGRPGEFGLLIQDGEDVCEFDFALQTVFTVFPPAVPTLEFEIRGRGLEVDVDELESASIGHFDGEKLAA